MISVVVPVYNTSRYLGECLTSLMEQTNHDFEIILVDDGSTDNSGEMCDAFAAHHDNTTVIHTANQGLCLARRNGFDLVNGDYVVCLDSDDKLLPDAIATIQGIIEEKPSDIIIFDYLQGENDSSAQPNRGARNLAPGFYDVDAMPIVKHLAISGVTNHLWGKAIRANLLPDRSYYSDALGLCYGEDLYQLLYIVDQAQSATYIKEPLHFYRMNPASLTNSFSSKHINELDIVFKKAVSFASKWGPSYRRDALSTVCMHSFKLFAELSISSLPWSQKKKNAEMIRQLILRQCENDINAATQKLPIQIKVPLRLLAKGYIHSALKCAYVAESLFYLKQRLLHSHPLSSCSQKC